MPVRIYDRVEVDHATDVRSEPDHSQLYSCLFK